MHCYSSPSPSPWSTWDYNKAKDPKYTTSLGFQISTATAVDAIRHPGYAYGTTMRFSTIQDRLIMAPRSYMLQQSAMLSADDALAQIQQRRR